MLCGTVLLCWCPVACSLTLDGMAAVRARFAAMQTTLKTVDQAAEDASQRKF
jgi:hypothetical protein